MRIVCLSDTHGLHDQLTVPDGDMLLHAGDFSMRGTADEVADFDAFLGSLPHKHKVVIAGNHDRLFEEDPERARGLLRSATYLQDNGLEVEGLSVWGAPWQPWFHDWAFNLERGPALAKIWAKVPIGVDILLTHGPPFGMMDQVKRGGHSVGCEELSNALESIQPKLHVFGHIHEARGWNQGAQTLSINACNCTFWYESQHAPVVVEWDKSGPRVVT